MYNNTAFHFSPPNNLCQPNHGSTDGGEKMDSYIYASSLSCSIIIAVLSPVAVVGNALILAAIWRRNFQRTPFKVLLSGLAFTDFCTGLIAQPFTAFTDLRYLALDCRNLSNRPLSLITMDAIGDASATYFISSTAIIITLIGVERWLHMTKRSLVTSPCGYFIVIVLLAIPIPVVVFRAIETIKGNPAFEFNVTIIAAALLCLSTTSVAYFKVLRITRRHRQQVRADERSQHFGQAAINLEKYNKAVSTILYVLALFYGCFVPFIISTGMYVYVGGDESRGVSVALDVTTALLFLSSSLNPFLLLWRMNDVRSGVKQLFCSEHLTEM